MWLSSPQFLYPLLSVQRASRIARHFPPLRKCACTRIPRRKMPEAARVQRVFKASSDWKYAAIFSILPKLAASTRVCVDSFTAACKF